MKDTFGIDALNQELSIDEGRRLQAYLDTEGLVTIGVGRELTHHGITDAECDFLLANDISACCDIMDKQIAWWRGLPPTQQRVMVNLCFMGWGSFSQFHKFLSAMQAHDFKSAATELKNSRWWTQVRLRGPRVVARLLSSS